MYRKPSDFHIVSIEDDPSVAKGLVIALEAVGYRVSHFFNGETFLDQVDQLDTSLLILDIRLPGKDGFTVCREIRQRFLKFPILMLTARDDEADKVMGLEDGADGYMVKPFSLKELMSRIRAILRRSYGELSDPSDHSIRDYFFGSYCLSPDHLKLLKDGSEVVLTPMEFRLLLFMLKNRDTVFNRKEILKSVWSVDSEYYGDERTVDVHIRHLRKKIEEDPSNPVYFKTQRGEGYIFSS